MKKQTKVIIAAIILAIVVAFGGHYGYQKYSLSKAAKNNSIKVDTSTAANSVEKAAISKDKTDIEKAKQTVDKLPSGETKDTLKKRIDEVTSDTNKPAVKGEVNTSDKTIEVNLNTDSTILPGFTFLKISFDGMNKQDYAVKYGDKDATWSVRFNCFAVKFDGNKPLSEFNSKNVSIVKKK